MVIEKGDELMDCDTLCHRLPTIFFSGHKSRLRMQHPRHDDDAAPPAAVRQLLLWPTERNTRNDTTVKATAKRFTYPFKRCLNTGRKMMVG